MKVVSALVSAFLTGRPMLMTAEKLPLLLLGSRRGAAEIGQSLGGQNFGRGRQRVRPGASGASRGDGLIDMSGTSKVTSEKLILRSAGVSAMPWADVHQRRASGHLRFQVVLRTARHLVGGLNGHARGRQC